MQKYVSKTNRLRHRIDISEGIDVNKTKFVTAGILRILVLSMRRIFPMVVMI